MTQVHQIEQEMNSGLEALMNWHWIGVFQCQAIAGKTIQYDTGADWQLLASTPQVPISDM